MDGGVGRGESWERGRILEQDDCTLKCLRLERTELSSKECVFYLFPS
jgi:hypothetical protein